MSQQGDRQASVRAVTGTALTYEGDFHALFTAASVAAGTFDERLLAWINLKLGATYNNLPQAQQALATSLGATNFGAIGTFDASTVLSLLGTPGPATQNVAYSFAPVAGGGTPPYTFSKPAGTLPTGLTLDTATGIISGTPTVVATSSGITERVTDALSATADLTGLSIVVSAPLVLTNAPATTASISAAYSYIPTTTGGRGTITWAITGKPTWASFSTVTGALTGTTPGSPETDTGITITGTDADGRTVTTGAFQILINATPISDIIQAEIMGVTALDPDGGSPSIGINMNGALMRIRALVLDNVTLPNPTKIIPVAVDAGFDNSSGAILAHNWTRTLTPFANALLHRQATGGGNQTVVYIEQPSGTIKALASLTVGQYADFFVTLPEFIYPSSNVSVTATAGWYSTAAAGSGPAVTNSSTKGFPNPKYGWMNWPCERIEASTYTVELWCNGHRHAMNAQAVAGVQLWGADGTHTSPVSEIVTTTLGTIQNRGAIAEVFHAAVSLTGVSDTDGTITNGAGTQFIDGFIYPWIGPRYQLSVDGIAWPTAQPCRILPFVKDTAGKYGGGIFYVNAAGAGGAPAVSRTPAANYAAAVAKAYATEALGRAALVTFNSGATGRPAGAISHADTGGAQVHYLCGAAADQGYELAGNIATAGGNCWYEFMSAPVNVAQGFKAFYNQSTLRSVQSLTRGNGLDCVKGSTLGVLSGGDSSVGSTRLIGWKDSKVSLNAGTTTPWLRTVGMVAMSGINFDAAALGTLICSLSNEGASGLRCIHAVGITYGTSATTQGQFVTPYFAVGLSGKLIPSDPSATQQTTNDGFVVDNCQFNALSSTVSLIQTFAFTRGAYLGQTLIEYIAAQDFGISGGGSGIVDLDDVLLEYITNPNDAADFNVDLGRFNGPYNDSGGTRGRRAYVQDVGYAGARRAKKSDVFSVVNGGGILGNVGNFECEYGVGCFGDRISVARPFSFSVGIVVQKVGDAQFTDSLGNLSFTSNKAGVGNTGFGTYSLPPGANSLKDAIPAGKARRRLDFFGNARLNDGHGAAGLGEGS